MSVWHHVFDFHTAAMKTGTVTVNKKVFGCFQKSMSYIQTVNVPLVGHAPSRAEKCSCKMFQT